MTMRTRNQAAPLRIASFLLVALALFGYGCASTEKPQPTAVDAAPPGRTTGKPYGRDLKSRLDHIIDHRLNESEAIKVLDVFAVDDYNIQDPNTFWGHRAVAGSGGPYSEYYFTYRSRYFILFLQDKNTVDHFCIDIRMVGKTRSGYELNAGRVRVDEGEIDEEVVVLFNKTWNGEYSTDILAAFKPVVASRKIETLKYRTIRIYRED